MAIQLTSAALDRVRQFLAAEPDALGLRFGVRKTGCSGWGYEVELARDARAGDSVSEQDGVRVYVDRKSTRLNSSHVKISYAVFCLKKKIYHPKHKNY